MPKAGSILSGPRPNSPRRQPSPSRNGSNRSSSMALLGRCNRLDDDRLFQHYIEDLLYKGVALSIASSCLFAGLYYHATLLIPLDGEDIFGWRMLLTLLKCVINAS